MIQSLVYSLDTCTSPSEAYELFQRIRITSRVAYKALIKMTGLRIDLDYLSSCLSQFTVDIPGGPAGLHVKLMYVITYIIYDHRQSCAGNMRLYNHVDPYASWNQHFVNICMRSFDPDNYKKRSIALPNDSRYCTLKSYVSLVFEHMSDPLPFTRPHALL